MEFSQLLKKHVRDEDKVFRWGGEEFVAALDTAQDEGLKVAKRIKDAIATQSFTKNTNITVSIGIASGKMSDFEDLVQKADEALHYAKKTKNSIEIYPIEKENIIACT